MERSKKKVTSTLAAADAAHGAYVFQARQREAYLAGLERQRARTPAACCSKAHYCSPRSAHAREMCTSSMSHADRAGDLVSFPFPHSHAVLDCNLPASADASYKYKHGCKKRTGVPMDDGVRALFQLSLKIRSRTGEGKLARPREVLKARATNRVRATTMLHQSSL